MKHKIKRLLSLLLSLMMLTAALPTSIWAEETRFAQATGAEAELPSEPETTAEPELPVESPEATDEPEFPSDLTELPSEIETPAGTAEPTPQVTEEPLPTPEPEAAYQAGVFVLVTENTRVFSDVDETADEVDGELYDGSFVRTANVRVEEVRQDGMGRTWLLVRYLYGEEEPDGEMAWTDTATVWVMAEETQPSDAADYDVTAYAFPFTPVELYAANNPPRLQTLSGNTGEFYAGQTVYAYSVHDDVQIASLKNYGAIYATRHYINEHVVYCLEHTMNSPGIRNNPDGPYHVVDLAQYGQTQGYSGIIYSEKTMHAIGWVLRHTFPFMGLDRYEDECLEWSRAAGQFAIREVIKQLEGSQYVRDYWHMDEFYRATGQAPKEYLEYARWLAANALTYAQMTGEITVSNVSVSVANGVCTGTATLTTDAPRIRIRRSVGTITGYTGGEDGTYVYLNSGDTITVSQAGSGFSFTAESVSTEELEANFLIAVPDANVQKVVIPQRGSPYPLKSTEIRFDMPNGALVVTKTDAASGAVLAGATFELTNASGTVVATQTTDADGAAHFDNLPAGNYTVREINAPTGYLVAVPDSQSVTVTAGGTTGAAFADERIQGRIRIAKTDSLTKEPLAGAEFTITRTDGTGTPIVLTTDANGNAETDWLDYGRYRVTESKVPAHYETSGFSTEIDCTENGKTYLIEAENEPMKGFIQIVKTDALDGRPIEGVQFDIVDAGGNVVGTMTTDANGAATSPALFKGQYTVREHENPTGYVAELAQQDAAVNPDETTYLGASNQPIQGRIRIVKRDQLTKELLAGATIKDRQGNVLFKKGDTVVDLLTTAGEDASAATGELWPGLYEIVELTPPKGYHPSEKHIFVDTVSAAGQSEEAVVEYEGLKTNTIRLGAQAIVKILGDDHDDPAPDRVEQPEAGAEFNVYLKSAGNYENARPFERDHLVTNKRGYAKTKALPYGIYVLEQTKGKEGYEIKGAIEFEIDGTEDIQNPPPLTLSDRPILYRLRIFKTDRETGKTVTLAHTSFKLKDANGETVRQTVHYPTEKEIDTFTTDETGGVTLPETLRWGLYYIEEISAPEGYLIQTESLPVMIGHDGDEPGQTYELNIEMQDEPVKGQILVKKTGDMLVGFETVDAYGYAVQKPVYEQRNLAGAVFELRAAEEIVGRDGTAWYAEGELVDTIITTAGGEDASKLLPLGRYTLTEVKAPEGYAPDDAPREIELAYADDQTPLVQIRVEVGNTYLPAAITLHKEAEVIRTTEANGEVLRTLHSEPGEGFVFGLFSERDIHENGVTLLADTLVAVGMTDENGRLTFDGTFPHGDYYVRELQAKTGWKLNPNRFPITLEPGSDAVIRVELAQPIYDELVYTPVTLTKTDITGAKTVPGAQIEVRNEQSEMIYRATTDANGEIPDIPVTPGTYAFREILAPSGYALNEAETRFTVDEQGNVTGNTMLRDDYTRVQLRKQDENGVPLSGVEFALVTETGTRLMTAVSDANGLVTFEKIPYGRYTVEETQPLPGYFKAAVHVRLTVDGAFINPNEPLETVTNTPMRLAYKKVDTSGRPLAGVEFSLINAATNVVTEVAASDENGEFIFRHIDYGDWIIRETAAPNGYRRMEDMLLHIGEDFVQPEPITLVNVPNSYMFMKMDGDGNPLSGVKFVLEDADGNVLREMESGEDGTVLLENLEDGRYVIRETEALQGYAKTEDTLTFTIDESYVVPEEMPCLVNKKEDEKHDIQTGVDIELTPMMTEGAALLLLAGIILIGRRLADRKRRKK